MTHVDPHSWPVLLSEGGETFERAAAESHARDCAPCQAERRRAEALVTALAALTLPAPNAAALARAKAPIVAELRAALRAQKPQPAWARRLALALLALLPPIGAAALASGVPFEVGHGLRCSGIELLAAVFPVALLALVVRVRGLAASPIDFALAAGGGALVGQGMLVALCASHSLAHLMVFHAAVVWVAAAMGAVVGRLQRA